MVSSPLLGLDYAVAKCTFSNALSLLLTDMRSSTNNKNATVSLGPQLHCNPRMANAFTAKSLIMGVLSTTHSKAQCFNTKINFQKSTCNNLYPLIKSS